MSGPTNRAIVSWEAANPDAQDGRIVEIPGDKALCDVPEDIVISLKAGVDVCNRGDSSRGMESLGKVLRYTFKCCGAQKRDFLVNKILSGLQRAEDKEAIRESLKSIGADLTPN